MRVSLQLCATAALCMMLMGCGKVGATTTTLDRRIVVSGAAGDVDRFAAAQQPLLTTASIVGLEKRASGRSALTLVVPAKITNDQLTAIREAALSDGLAYQFTEHRSVHTSGGFTAAKTITVD
jgi:hypothetical protein